MEVAKSTFCRNISFHVKTRNVFFARILAVNQGIVFNTDGLGVAGPNFKRQNAFIFKFNK